jgi:hypothetical protein
MASAPPEISFYKILQTTGVETVEEARRAKGGQSGNDGAVME